MGSGVTDKWGLALGGGGAPGVAAHLGFLDTLYSYGLVPDFVAGTSAGGIVAGSLAAKIPLTEIISTWSHIADDPWRLWASATLGAVDLLHPSATPGLLDLGIVLGYIPRNQTINDWSSQYAVVATSLAHRTPTVFSNDKVGGLVRAEMDYDEVPTGPVSTRDAIKASAAFPGIFQGVRLGDDLLCDGGLFDMVPTDICRALGASKVISVRIGAAPTATEAIPAKLPVTDLLQIALREGLAKTDQGTNTDPADMHVYLNTYGGLLDLSFFNRDYEIGVAAAQSKRKDIESLIGRA